MLETLFAVADDYHVPSQLFGTICVSLVLQVVAAVLLNALIAFAVVSSRHYASFIIELTEAFKALMLRQACLLSCSTSELAQ